MIRLTPLSAFILCLSLLAGMQPANGQQPTPEPSPFSDHPDNRPGPIISSGGTNGPWTSNTLPFNLCCNLPTEFAGQIRLKNGDGIAETNIQLINDPDTLLGAFQNGDNGWYTFSPDSFPIGIQTYVKPEKNDNPLGDVSTYDLVLLNQYFLEDTIIRNPCLYLAADINGDQVINKADITDLRKLILGIYPNFPNNSAWRFFPEDYTFPTLGNPLANVPDRKYLIDFDAPDDGHFIGVKVGNLNTISGNNLSSDGNDARMRAAKLTVSRQGRGDRRVQAGEPVSLRVTPDADLRIFQGTIVSDQIIWTDVEPLAGMTDENFGQLGQALSFSWNGEQNDGFILHGRALAEGDWTDFIQLSNDITEIEAYRVDGRSTLDLYMPCGQNTASLRWMYHAPNPFHERVSIYFVLPFAQSVNCSVFDPLGRNVLEINQLMDAGEQTLMLNLPHTGESGVYIVRLKTANEQMTHKLERY